MGRCPCSTERRCAMSETLAGLELEEAPRTATDDAVRALNRVKVSMIADRDRATEALRVGGTYKEMRTMTDIWRVLDEGIRGIERAVGYLLKSEESDDDE